MSPIVKRTSLIGALAGLAFWNTIPSACAPAAKVPARRARPQPPAPVGPVPSVWAPPTPVTSEPKETAARRDLTVEIANDKVRLKFKSAEQGFGLGSMVFLENGREAISQVDAETLWWSVLVRLKNGKIVTLDNLSAPAGKFTPFADRKTGGEFVWKGLKPQGDGGTLDVTVTVRLEPGSSLARLRIGVANRLRDGGLWKILFPKLNHLGYPRESDCAVPTSWSMMNQGELRRAATGLLHWSYLGNPMEYPSGSMAIQHLSCSIGENTVVYLGCHDGQGNTKGYGWKMEEGLTFHIYPENMGVPGEDYTQTWDYVIGPMRGDWFDAALVYREWAIRQPWCAKGRLETRTDKPKSFFEVPYWGDPQWPGSGFRDKVTPMDRKASELEAQFQPAPGSFDPNAKAYDVQSKEMIRRVAASIEAYGLPLGVQWYTWHKARFDGDYPDYFPPRPGFTEALKSLARPGLYQTGFINGSWFDRALPNYREAAPNTILTREEVEKSNDRIDPLVLTKGAAYMCPTTPYWQKSLADIARKMADVGFQGAYLDVTANVGGVLCFNATHGHPVGGGHWSAQATRRLVEGMKGEGKLIYITSEGFNESLGQAVDLFYTKTDWRPETAPVMGAIYGGYLQWYGSDNSPTNAAELTRCVFWGGHVSPYANWDFRKGRENFRDFLVHLTKIQRSGVKYLTYGTMVRPPNWGAGQKETENLEHATWKASDGTVALFLMNYVPRPQQAILNLATMRGLTIDRSPQVIQPAGTAPVTVKLEGDQLKVDIPKAFPLMIVLGTMKP